MDFDDIDFNGSNNNGTNAGEPTENKSAEDITPINHDADKSDVTSADNANANEQEQATDETADVSIKPGDSLDIDGVTHTVDENGNIVNDKGEVFKKADEVKDWLKSVNVGGNDEDENELNISNLQKAIGIDVTDEAGNVVEFANDVNGVKSYIDSVINIRSTELQEAAVNKLYSDNPMLKEFRDYVQLNGSPKGFAEIPDRTNIVLDRDNPTQLEAVIRMAAKEFNITGITDNYINYLKDSHGLYNEAKAQLEALVKKDTDYKKQIEVEAEKRRQAEKENAERYWKNVRSVIDSKKIGGYEIPNNITKTIDGKKVILNTSDFYNYVSRQSEKTEDGRFITAYQKDLNAMTEEQALHKELIDAWLAFTGGSYKDLVEMAIRKDNVKQLKIKSAEAQRKPSVKIKTNANRKSSIDDIVLQ